MHENIILFCIGKPEIIKNIRNNQEESNKILEKIQFKGKSTLIIV